MSVKLKSNPTFCFCFLWSGNTRMFIGAFCGHDVFVSCEIPCLTVCLHKRKAGLRSIGACSAYLFLDISIFSSRRRISASYTRRAFWRWPRRACTGPGPSSDSTTGAARRTSEVKRTSSSSPRCTREGVSYVDSDEVALRDMTS